MKKKNRILNRKNSTLESEKDFKVITASLDDVEKIAKKKKINKEEKVYKNTCMIGPIG